MTVFLKSIALVALSMAEPLHGTSQTAADGAETVLVERADRRCARMLVRFLRSRDGVTDPEVRRATTDCYLAEATLVVLGHDRALLAGKPPLTELAARKLSQANDLVLDPYSPLASVRFAAPGAGVAE